MPCPYNYQELPRTKPETRFLRISIVDQTTIFRRNQEYKHQS
ncbi:hypothetical protein [Microseira wollei]|nr:hypothetical protein [Microseira wollei]